MSARFRIHPNHTATLAGVDHRDLRSVFDAAAIHYYDMVQSLERKKRLTADDREGLAWAKAQLKVLDAIKIAVDAGIKATFPCRPKRVPTKADRLKAVRAVQQERLFLASIIAAV